MRKREIEKNLNLIISNSVPDVLDDILTKCEKKKGFESKVNFMKKEIEKKEKRSFMPKLAWSFAAVILCIGAELGFNQYNKVYKTDSVIGFDVNPSVELKVNKNEEVIKVVPLNEDGKKILEDMDFKKVDLDVAVNAIVGSMLKNGYITIDENSILVSVKNDDVEKANKLKEEISKEIEEILSASAIKGSILSQAYNTDDNAEKVAEENNVSEGKAKLINDILNSNIKDSKGNAYTFESLSKLSINELNLLLTSKKVELKDTKTTGEASSSSYITKSKAKSIALSNANVSSSKIKNYKIELDCDDGLLVYEIEFDTTNAEYEYEINAKTGAIIAREIDKNDDGNGVSSNSNSNSSTNTNRYDDDYDDDDDDDDHYDD